MLEMFIHILVVVNVENIQKNLKIQLIGRKKMREIKFRAWLKEKKEMIDNARPDFFL